MGLPINPTVRGFEAAFTPNYFRLVFLLSCIVHIRKIFRTKLSLLWCSTACRQHQLPTTAHRVGPDLVSPSPWVRDLGIFTDADLSVCIHVQQTVASSFTTNETVAQHQAVSPSVRLPVACRRTGTEPA